MTLPPRSFLPPSAFHGAVAQIEGAPYHHLIHVLRLSPGSDVILLDGTGSGWHARITHVERGAARAEILEPIACTTEPGVHVTVAQAIGKGTKFEEVIQHGTELGCYQFIALQSARTVVRVADDAQTQRRDRWATVALNAAEQSGRMIIPAVVGPMTFMAMLAACAPISRRILLDAPGNGQARPLTVGDYKTIVVAVGPEGGWTAEERRAAVRAGWIPASLGARTLRTETAGLAAVSHIIISTELEENTDCGKGHA